MNPDRTLPWDWHRGAVPANVVVAEDAFVETTFSFLLHRSLEEGRIGHAASIYGATMFDTGPRGRICIGDFTLINGARIICDEEISIGDHVLISWNVVLMDTYRLPLNAEARRLELERIPRRKPRRPESEAPTRPVRIGANAWIGFDSCILPGVTIGEGAVVGARSVVVDDVPPYAVVAGNPARIVRRLAKPEGGSP